MSSRGATALAGIDVVEVVKPLRSDAARNRTRLLRVGIELLAEHGVDVPVEAIARSAEVGVGTLYRHFPSKDDLLAAIADDMVDHVLRLADDADLIAPVGAGFESFVFEICALQSRYGRILGKLWSLEPAASRLRDEVAPRMVAMLTSAQRAGLIRTDANDSDIALLVWSVAGIVENSRVVVPDAWQRMFAMAMTGLRPGPTLDRAAMTSEQMNDIRAYQRRQHNSIGGAKT